MTDERRIIQIPNSLCKAVEDQFVGRDFADLDSLITFILQELTQSSDQKLDEAEEQIIEERLRDLGYL